MLDTTGTPMIERRHRQRSWTGGLTINLADRAPWRFPILDFSLIVTTSNLIDDIEKAFWLSQKMRETGSNQTSLPSFHVHMGSLGLRLLQANYDLPHDD